jgi:hypothetical protein
MREFPGWKRPIVDWSEVAQLGQSQVQQVVADLSTGTSVVRAIPSRAVQVAGLTRRRCEQLPSVIVGELRRRVNPLDLATKHDVEGQSKLGRNRVSFVLKEFLEEQLRHDQALIASIRAELREELETFAAALNDTVFAVDAPSPPAKTQGPHRRAADLEFVTDVDDEIDGMDPEWIHATGDERIDRIGEDDSTRRQPRYETGI